MRKNRGSRGALSIGFCCGVLLAVVACGDGGDAKPDDNGDQADGGDEKDGGAQEDVGTVTPCSAGQANLRVGGQERMVKLGADSWTAGLQLSTKGWAFGSELDQHGYAVIRGPETLDRSASDGPRTAFNDGETLKVSSSYWLFDASASSTGVITCSAGDSSTVQRKGDELELDLKAADTIPACPGKPVDGSIVGCITTKCATDQNNIAGTRWTAQANGRSIGGSRGSYAFDDRSFVLFDANGMRSGSVSNWGLLFTSGDSPFAGRVFCVGKIEFNDDGTHHFSDLSELPTCPSKATGTLRGCAR